MNILVIAPHPDDEAIGCGGTICAHIARGDRVVVVFLTSGEVGAGDISRTEIRLIREREAQKASSILGVSSITFLRCHDQQLEEQMQEAAAALRPILECEQPQLMYLTHPLDWHPDHRAALPIVQAALRDTPAPGPDLLTYEVMTPLTEYDRAEDITPFMKRKLRAVRAHRSQIKQFPYDRGVRALSEYRSVVAQVGLYAEVFQFADGPATKISQRRRADPSWHRAYRVAEEITNLVSSGESFILVDDNQLDIAPLLLPRTPIPFLERNGRYWGSPPDADTAIRELNRLQQFDPAFMIFAWPAFWWFDQYPDLKRHLDCEFQCVLANQNLLAFDLRRTPETCGRSLIVL